MTRSYQSSSGFYRASFDKGICWRKSCIGHGVRNLLLAFCIHSYLLYLGDTLPREIYIPRFVQ